MALIFNLKGKGIGFCVKIWFNVMTGTLHYMTYEEKTAFFLSGGKGLTAPTMNHNVPFLHPDFFSLLSFPVIFLLSI